MATYKIKLQDRQVVAQDTISFFFEKPSNFTFKPGQFGEFTLINPPETDSEGNGRAFTIASPPSAEQIMITTRLRDTAFKRVMQRIPLGTEVTLDGPHGAFTLHHKQTTPAVFIAGGIGITPARSIILQAVHDKLPHTIYLFYANHTPETTAFLDELQALENQKSNLKIIPIMTSMHQSQQTWKGEKGHLDCAMLSRYIDELSEPIYYISGPPSMVAATQQMLNACGIDDDNIRAEEFPGY